MSLRAVLRRAAREDEPAMRLDVISPRVNAAPEPNGVASLWAKWRVGAVLEAIAVRDASTGQLFLDMGGRRYAARLASGHAGTEPANGERMQLRVLRNSPVLALERIAGPAPGHIDAEVAAAALRKLVPRQTSPTPLLANLAWVARGGGESLPEPVARLAQQIWQALPDVDDLSDPTRLERALNRSGTFLEAALANDDGTPAARAAIANDLKALMLQLGRVLREHGARPDGARFADNTAHAPLPTASGPLSSLSGAPATLALLDGANEPLHELARQADGALARIATTQVANCAQDPLVQSLLIEVPMRYEQRASVLRLRIRQQAPRQHSREHHGWNIEAALDLGSSGALYANVWLNGFRVGVQLRAESSTLVEQLSARAPQLEAMLRESGLEVDRIVCRHGMPTGDAGERLTRLLDVHV